MTITSLVKNDWILDMLTELSIRSKTLFSCLVKSIVQGGSVQPSTLIFSRLVSFSGQNGMAD